VLGDYDWPPYASAVIIEIHQVNINGTADSGNLYPKDSYMFRLLYNGKVMTHLIDGCTQSGVDEDGVELCGVQVLIDRVDSFATAQKINCTRSSPEVDDSSSASTLALTADNIVSMFLLALGSAMLGSLATYLRLRAVDRRRTAAESLSGGGRRKGRNRDGRSQIPQTDHDEEDDIVEIVSSEAAGYNGAITSSAVLQGNGDGAAAVSTVESNGRSTSAVGTFT